MYQNLDMKREEKEMIQPEYRKKAEKAGGIGQKISNSRQIPGGNLGTAFAKYISSEE